MWAILLILVAVWLLYFYMRNEDTSTHHVEQDPSRSPDISVDELVDGYEFYATLDIHTPLKILEHHGEIRRGPKAALPEYGTLRDGLWLEFFKDYSSRPSKENLADLEFLKKFRRAYEGNLSNQRKHETISALVSEYRHTRQASHAANWFMWELLEIPGISASIAEVLYSQGIKTKEDVKAASDEELLSIPGIGPGRLRQIRVHFSMQTESRTNG